VEKSFYVDDGLTGADSIEESIELQRELFSKGGFLLHKWNFNQPTVLQHIPSELKDTHSNQALLNPYEYTKTLGIDFHLTIADLPPVDCVTKRVLVSDIAKTFDVLGWFSPAIIKVKVMMQRLWELKVEWDDPLLSDIRQAWLQ
jgi:hypothetical protein